MDHVVGFWSIQPMEAPKRAGGLGKSGTTHSPSSLLAGMLLTGDLLSAPLCLQVPGCSVPQHLSLTSPPTPTDSYPTCSFTNCPLLLNSSNLHPVSKRHLVSAGPKLPSLYSQDSGELRRFWAPENKSVDRKETKSSVRFSL